jgi:hypothetical protein
MVREPIAINFAWNLIFGIRHQTFGPGSFLGGRTRYGFNLYRTDDAFATAGGAPRAPGAEIRRHGADFIEPHHPFVPPLTCPVKPI